MTLVTNELLAELLTVRPAPCLSVYQPTHPFLVANGMSHPSILILGDEPYVTEVEAVLKKLNATLRRRPPGPPTFPTERPPDPPAEPFA
jgi:hypothetical protein